MEIKINREILNYTEAIFFGLTIRQCLFSILAIGIAVLIYFTLNPILGLEMTGWMCVVSAFPFAVLGFVKYNGMPAEKLIWAWLKSELLLPKRLLFRSTNYYYQMMKPYIEIQVKEGMKIYDKNHVEPVQTG